MAKTARDSGYQVAPEQVLVTNGGKQAVYNTFAALLDPGDEVLLPAPYWTTYPEAIKLAGGTPVEVFAGEDQGYLVTVEQLEAARTPQTKVLLFCSPSNPTGAVYPPEQVRAIGQWALAHGIWVVTDEIYEHLTYDGARSVSMPVEVPELADTCVVLNGVAKTYAMTGWRVGWMVGPPRRGQGRHQPAVARHLQRGQRLPAGGHRGAARLAGGGRGDEGRVRPAPRRPWSACSTTSTGVQCPVPQGAFYVYPSVKGILGRTIRGARRRRRPSWPR